MRDYACPALHYHGASTPLSPTSTPPHHKSLALADTFSAALPHDLQVVPSLPLQSLIEAYFEPAGSHPSSSFLPYPPHNPSNHNPFFEDQKSLTHELQAILQNVGENYGEVRKEVMRAIIRNGGDSPNSSSQNYEQVHAVVLGRLRKMGLNAGICKSHRDPHKNSHQRLLFPAEEYEYMDVILGAEKGRTQQAHASESERVIIDLRFRSQFEIARPSTAYADLLKVVPIAYVGTPRVLHKTIRILSEAIKRSLESQGMPLPPWRRLSFLHSKWLSPYYSRSIFAPPPKNLHSIINKSSIKRENSLCSTTRSPSPFSTKRENSHAGNDNSQCLAPKPCPLVDSKHKLSSLFTTKRENSHSMLNNLPPLVTKPPLHVDSKRVLKSCNSASHIPRNSPNKQSSIQSGEPIKVPWQLPPLSNPPNSLKRSKRLVGALTIALHYGLDSSTISGPFKLS